MECWNIGILRDPLFHYSSIPHIFRIKLGWRLSGFQYFPRPKTTSADPYVTHRAVLYSPHPLQIGIPSSFGFVIRMTDIVARLRAFSAYLANLGHYFIPPIGVASL